MALWNVWCLFFFFFLPIVVLLIKHLFKYSFVVGLLLLLLCLNGSVHHLKNGGEGKFTTWPLKPIQPWKNYASPTSICIYSAHLFQRNLGRFFRNRSYSYQIYMVLGLKISRQSSPQHCPFYVRQTGHLHGLERSLSLSCC